MKKFDRELTSLKQQVAEMGELTEKMFALVIDALRDYQLDISSQVAEKEDQLDQMQLAIDHEAVRLLTVYGPVAGGGGLYQQRLSPEWPRRPPLVLQARWQLGH